MTIKHLLAATPTQAVKIVDIYGTAKEIDRESPLTVAAYSDFVIETITATDRNTLEITIKLEPVKEK